MPSDAKKQRDKARQDAAKAAKRQPGKNKKAGGVEDSILSTEAIEKLTNGIKF
jgi:hypothetical protein